MRLAWLGDADREDRGEIEKLELEPEEDRQAGRRPHALDHGADEIVGDVADDHENQVDDDQPHGFLWGFVPLLVSRTELLACTGVVKESYFPNAARGKRLTG